MLQIHMLTLGSHLQAHSFEDFARSRYLPSLRAPEGRDGQLLSVRLLRRRRTHERDPLDAETQFLLVSDWNGKPGSLPATDDPALRRLFEAFGVEITSMGSFEAVE